MVLFYHLYNSKSTANQSVKYYIRTNYIYYHNGNFYFISLLY